MAEAFSSQLVTARGALDRLARRSPARLAVFSFAGVVVLFTLLLLGPWATRSGKGASVVDALFTATSAVCVTGLTVVPTGAFWSPFGEVVILVAIKVGGLGVMTLASILGLAVSRHLGLTQRMLAATEVKTTRLGEVGSLIRVVIITSTSLELAVALLLFPRFLVLRQSVGEAAWHALFFGISAFNNAGFVPTVEGLDGYVGDWALCLPIIVGVFIGSLGFPVILNIMRNRRRLSSLSLHAKLTLVTGGALVVVGAVLFLALEWTNPGTFGPLSVPDKILASLFQGVMPRSAGFSTVDIGSMHETSWLITDALMFVGGGSASTAGGIKVTTLAVMLLAIVAEARGDRDIEVFRRRIPHETIRLAIAVTFVGATAVLVSSLLLLEITGWSLDVVMYEVISAFATVGLSTGVTPHLPDAGKYVLVVLMFVGRTGTMTLGAALALRSRRRVVRMPEERPIIG
ncbi:TrkH family potassium uptake protein [Luteimicrobium sp. DT211]|uniref:TrkH family potassium uptake protein n=1 Tax=Luteimicrobium sp. DT211 TaxID=3393412 RepID=UPI003CF814A2